MTNEQIDQFIEFYKDDNANPEGIVEFLDDEELKKVAINEFKYPSSEDVLLEMGFKAYKNIMAQIEREGYEYFYERLPECSYLAVDLLGYLSDKSKLTVAITDESLELESWEKMAIIERTADPDYIMSWLNSGYFDLSLIGKIRLVRATKSTKYIREFLNENIDELNPDEVKSLIKATGDLDFIKSWLSSSYFDSHLDFKIDLVKSTGSSVYIQEFVKDNMNYLELDNIMDLVKASRDTEYIKKWAENKEFDLTDEQRLELIFLTGDKEYVEGWRNDERIGKKIVPFLTLIKGYGENNVDINRELTLPKDMTIGMEIESEGIFSKSIISQFNFGKWKAKGDDSLINGVEVISPILHSDKTDTEQVYMVCNALSSLGQKVSERCGGHIHIGADYLTSIQAYVNLMEIWCNAEKILYLICNWRYNLPRRDVVSFAKTVSAKTQKAIEKGTISLNSELELDEFISELKLTQDDDRHYGLNLLNVNNGKNTIEFRVANGTLNPDLWVDNINLFGGIVAVSEELAQIQERGISDDRGKLELFEELKEDISEEERLDVLLKLIGLDEFHYKDRACSNIALFRQYGGMDKGFFDVNGPVVFNKNSGIGTRELGDVSKEVSALAQNRAMENLVQDIERMRDRNLSIKR